MDIHKITHRLLGKRLLGGYWDSKNFVDWAVLLLENGYDTETLVILAGLDYDSTEEREIYFEQVVKELKIDIDKNDLELLEVYAKYIAEKVISRDIEPFDGLSIMKYILGASDYISKYMTFYELEEDMYYLKIDNQEEYLIEEFRLFLDMDKLQIDTISGDKSYCQKCEEFENVMLKTKYQFKFPYKYQIWLCQNCGSDKLEHFNNQISKRKVVNIIKSKGV